MARYAVYFKGTLYTEAKSEEEARDNWCNADFGEGKNLDVDSVVRLSNRNEHADSGAVTPG